MAHTVSIGSLSFSTSTGRLCGRFAERRAIRCRAIGQVRFRRASAGEADQSITRGAVTDARARRAVTMVMMDSYLIYNLYYDSLNLGRLDDIGSRGARTDWRCGFPMPDRCHGSRVARLLSARPGSRTAPEDSLEGAGGPKGSVIETMGETDTRGHDPVARTNGP